LAESFTAHFHERIKYFGKKRVQALWSIMERFKGLDL